MASPPTLDAPQRQGPAGLRLHRGHHRPACARPPAPAYGAPVRADLGGGGEHRHHLAPAQGGLRVGQDDHRHHTAEVPGHRPGDRRAAGQEVRGHRRRGTLLPVGGEHQEPQVCAGRRRAGGGRTGGGRGRDAGGGAGEPHPGRGGEARPAAEPVDVRVHRHAQIQNPGALRHAARGRAVRTLQPLQHAAGDRGGVHPRRAGQLHHVHGLLAAAEDHRGRPALRPREGLLPAEVLRRAASARDQREGGDHGGALRRAGAKCHRRSGQGHDRHPLTSARGALQAGRGSLPRGEGLPLQGLGGLLGYGGGPRQELHRNRDERLLGAADGPGLRSAGVSLLSGREQIPDGLRSTPAPHHVRGQEAGRRERRADPVAAEPDASGETRDDGARLRQRSRRHPQGL